MLENKEIINDFSVCMCVYGKDNPDFFRFAVDSVLCQTLTPNEVVIVVDGPVPTELDFVISDFQKNPIVRVFRLQTNQGHGNARRFGLDKCTYERVAMMDADDICVSNRFQLQIEFFNHNPEISVVGGIISEFIGSKENVVGKRVVPESHEEISKYLRYRCPFNQMTVMFNKNDVQSVGGYLDWYCEEDYYLWIRMFLAGKTFHNIPQVLVNVRVGYDMYQRRGGWKYFQSEKKIQNYLLKNKIISYPLFCINILKRFILQVIMPNRIRGFVFRKFAREKV